MPAIPIRCWSSSSWSTPINAIMKSKFWSSTAIIISYDDSDGWYDHQMSPIVNPSAVASADTKNSDQLNGAGKCGNGTPLEDAAGIPSRGDAAMDRGCRCW